MSFERAGRLTRFECDTPGCHRNFEGEEGFTSTWKEARIGGWVNAEARGVWTHYCPACERELGDD